MKNPKDLLIGASSFPAAIEAKLPEGAPKISPILLDTADKLPALPDFPVEIPDLPAPPELPEFELPTPPGQGGLPFITAATVTPIQERKVIVPSPVTGVLPEVRQRRGL